MSSLSVIWKHELPGTFNTLKLHKNAYILDVQRQGPNLYLWEAHNTAEPEKEERTFVVVGTGVTFEGSPNEELDYLGTIHINDTSQLFVFHVFEDASRRSW